jgi:hypothetical protein
METFCTAMNKTSIFTNEKECLSYNATDMSNYDDLGLVALDSQCIRNRAKCGISSDILDNLYNNIINKILLINNIEKKKKYISYLLKLIYKIRDIHEGNGERDIFYKLLIKLHKIQPKIVEFSLIFLVGGYDFNNNNEKFVSAPPGSFLDLNNLYKICSSNILDESKNALMNFILDLYKNTLLLDDCIELVNYPSLASKWAPRESSSLNKKYFMTNKLTEKIYGCVCSKNLKKYRNLIKNISDKLSILEKLMCSNEWDNIEVKNIPSKALIKYMKALKYINKDGTIRQPTKEDRLRLRERILEELNKCKTNPSESRINTKTLMPYELVSPLLNNTYNIDIEHYNSLWEKYVYDFRNNLSSNIKSGLCIADVSGSMSGLPLEVCISLSLLLSDLIEGPLKNKVITFSNNPTWHTITGNNLQEKVNNLKMAHWEQGTNFGKALDLILNTAKQYNLKQSELPEQLYVFSDMQWDSAIKNNKIDYNHKAYYTSQIGDKFITGYDSINKSFTDAGYKMPHIVFWNLRTTNNYNNKPNQIGTTMMSGFSANMFKSFLEGTFILDSTPWDTLQDILNSDRYTYLDNIIDKHYIN